VFADLCGCDQQLIRVSYRGTRLTRPLPCETSMMVNPSLTIKTRQFQATRNRAGRQYTRALF
jgi:hypothetical protein